MEVAEERERPEQVIEGRGARRGGVAAQNVEASVALDLHGSGIAIAHLSENKEAACIAELFKSSSTHPQNLQNSEPYEVGNQSIAGISLGGIMPLTPRAPWAKLERLNKGQRGAEELDCEVEGGLELTKLVQ